MEAPVSYSFKTCCDQLASVKMEAKTVERSVLDVINDLRVTKKKRPDKQSISNLLLKTKGLAMASTIEVIDMLLMEKKIINKKTVDGEDSFYTAKPTEVDAVSAVTPTLPTNPSPKQFNEFNERFHEASMPSNNPMQSSGEDKGRACRAQHDQFFYLKLFFSLPIMDEKMPIL